MNNETTKNAISDKRKVETEVDRNIIIYYIDIIRRRIWIILTIFIAVSTIGIITVSRQPKVYQAIAKVLVERQTPQIMRMDDMVQDQGGWDPEFFQTKAGLVSSRPVIDLALKDAAVSNLFSRPVEVTDTKTETKRTFVSMLGGTPPPPPEPWEILAGGISAEHLNDTHFILIKARNNIAYNAALIANAVASAYEKHHIELQRSMHGDTIDTLQEERKKEELELKNAENALQDFRAKTKSLTTYDSTREEPPVIRKLNDINSELTATQMQHTDLKSQAQVINSVIEAEKDKPNANNKLLTINAIKDDERVKASVNRLEEAEKEIAKLGQTYGPDHPVLKDATANAERMRKALNDDIINCVNSVMTKLATLTNKEEVLLKQYEDQKVIALEFSKELFDYNRLQTEIARHRDMFNKLVTKMSQVDFGKEFIKTNVKVVETAAIPSVPISPNIKRTSSFSLFLGLILGIGLALLVEQLDETIKTPEDLQNRTGIKVIGFIPKKDKTHKHGEQVPGTIIVQEPLSSFSEAIRNIRTNLIYALADDQKVIGFVSCGPGEGKTTVATNVAVSLAIINKKVLLIDTDMHRAMTDKSLGLNRAPGFSDILTGKTNDVLQKATVDGEQIENLDVICAGSKCASPAELLGTAFKSDFLNHIKTQYDWIIFDTPPILFVSDASIVSANCDGVVLVVKAGKHNRSVVNRALQHLKDIKVNLIGSVLNMMVVSRFGRYYSDYTYHGYSKYTQDYHASYYSSESTEGKKVKSATKNKS